MQHPNSTENELPLLGGIAGFIRWIEGLVTLLAGPLLTIGAGIGVVDLLSDGGLLASQPVLLYVYAFCQGIGVEAQFAASFDRAARALLARRYWAMTGNLLLGALLGYITWVAAQVFATQEADGLSTTQALASLGMSHTSWLVQRTFLTVGLVALSGWTRYHPPSKVHLTVEEELAEIERKRKIDAARRQARAESLTGLASLGRGAIASLQGGNGTERQDSEPVNESAGPDTPLVSEAQAEDASLEPAIRTEAEEQHETTVARQSPSSKRQNSMPMTAEERELYYLTRLETKPDLSPRELAAELGCYLYEAERIVKAYGPAKSQRRSG